MKNIRESLQGYKRDTYLDPNPKEINSKFTKIIDCEVGYSPFGCSPRMLSSIQTTDFTKVSCYPEMFYDKLLKPLIIDRFAGANLQPKNIFFGHGSFNLAERVIHKLIIPRSMLGYGPQFNEIPSEMNAAGGKYRPIPFSADFNFPLIEVLEELRTGNHSLLYVDNPNNPTGFLITMDVLEKLTSAANDKGTIALIDEAYGDFVPDENSAFNIVHKYPNLMVIRSFSKALGLAAQRIGYMAISQELIPYYSQVDVPFEPTFLSAIMAKLTLEDKDYIANIRKLSENCKTKIIAALKKSGIEVLPTYPSVSILTAHKSNFDLFAYFQYLGIKVENGVAYIETNKSMDNSFIRLRVPNEDQTNEVVNRISDNPKREEVT